MTFVQRTNWVDSPSTATPVMAADLLRIEQGVADAQNPTLATVATTGNYADLSGKPVIPALAGDLGGTAAAPTVISGANHTHTLAQITDYVASSVTIANLPAGSTLTVLKSGGVWPARPTSRSDIVVAWKGPDPTPAIVSSGTGGMLDNVDYRLVTP